jgi:hypothetical protein
VTTTAGDAVLAPHPEMAIKQQPKKAMKKAAQ